MKRTISAMVGKGSVSHNDRKFHAKNTDPSRTEYNITYCNEDIREVYHQLFDEALERYNAKQKRSDRRIADYYEKIRSGKQEKPFHELIIQIGNKDDTAADSQEGERAKQILNEYMKAFQERNPNLRVFSAHLHMDEATPHLHIDFIPFTTGSKRGLETRVSLKKALAAQGFKGGTRGDTEWNQWVNAEKERLAELMLEHGIEWEKLGTHEEHLSVLDYKKKVRAEEVAELDAQAQELTAAVSQRQEQVNELDEQKEQRAAEVEALDAVAVERAGEVAALDQQKAEKEDELSTLDAEIVEKRAESEKVERTLERVKEKKVRVSEIEAVKPKQIPLSNQVVLSKQDFDTLVSGAEQFVVQKKQESRLQKLLDKANAMIEGLKQTIEELREEIDRLKKELNEYKSVKGKLDRGKLERENRELKEENQGLRSYLDEYGDKSVKNFKVWNRDSL